MTDPDPRDPDSHSGEPSDIGGHDTDKHALPQPVPAKLRERRGVRIWPVVLALLVAALALWLASRVMWIEVTAFNDQSGQAHRRLTGATWQPALIPLAVGAVAAVAAVALVRGLAARIIGAALVLLAIAGAALIPGSIGAVDLDRVHSVVTSTDDAVAATTTGSAAATESQPLPSWTEITSATASPVGPLLSAIAVLLIGAAGLALAIRPPATVARDSKYESPAARRDAESGTGRGMWETLDDGEDPTV